MVSKPFAQPQFRKIHPDFRRPHAAFQAYEPGQLMQVYGIPSGLDATPQRIAIFELGGRYYPSDLAEWAKRAKMAAPTVNVHKLPGADDSPSDADGEVELDWQEAAAAYTWITGQPAVIDLIYGPNTGAAFAACQDYATNNLPDTGAGSWSWGSSEDNWLSVDRNSCHVSALQAPYPISAASGDNDADDGTGHLITDCPACLASIIACGGTSLPPGGVESVWNSGSGEGTGGGFSSFISRPSYQPKNSQAPTSFDGRMVPDIAMVADPATGIWIVVNGNWQPIGGTSAVAPRMAGIMAAVNGVRLKKGLPKITQAGQLLWSLVSSFFDIKVGNNRTSNGSGYDASSGPDPCTGLGRPLGTLVSLLTEGAAPPPPNGGKTGTLKVRTTVSPGTFGLSIGGGDAALACPDGLVPDTYQVGNQPTTPPPPAPAKLFSFTTRQDMPAGGSLRIRGIPVRVPAGTYDVIPHQPTTSFKGEMLPCLAELEWPDLTPPYTEGATPMSPTQPLKLTPVQWQNLLGLLGKLLPILGGIFGGLGGTPPPATTGQAFAVTNEHKAQLQKALAAPHLNLTPTQIAQLIGLIEQGLPLLGSILGITVG